ncbi:MAG: TetR/AcrR family transcriptional regulator [Rhodoferax sp.]|nr:TetR/AcrR family transcriptional regulator [Rhodoferax sp.]MCF8208260.1 TetR/AcrR family transcriptional regulator [Rhodoferax sp.]
MTQPKRPKLATEVRQASLMEAALRLAARHSPMHITTADLAREVGLTQGAVFRHFASKESIWTAVMDWTTAQLMAQLRAAADSASPAGSGAQPLAALRAVFLAHVAFVVEYPGVPRVIFQELQHAEDSALRAKVRGLMQQYRALLAELLAQAQAQQLLQPGTDLQAAAVLLIGSVQGLVMQSMLGGRVDTLAEQAPGVISIYLRGLTAKDPT